MKILFLFFFLLMINASPAQNNTTKRVISDTDMGPDYDDVGAITLLHAFADSGKIKILATIASTKYEGVAAVLNVLNSYFKKPTIPIAVPRGNALTQKDWQHWTDTLIANYPHAINHNSEVPDAVELYRKILSKQPDNSVTVITVGFLTNISNLLQSAPDKYSPLNGSALARKKIKQLVCMAGKFPEGYEFNVKEDAAASKYVFEHWQKPLLFSGFEIGQKIKSGLPLINNNSIQNSPVKDVFRICIPLAKEDSMGRMSWDETAVLVAVAGYRPFYMVRKGTIKVKDDGKNEWDPQGNKQFYLIENKPPADVQQLINSLIMHQPHLP
ncbi:MAG: nucleoside hydrolase [Ginsengibacter sp.]